MNESQLRKIVAEYDCITDKDPKLDLKLNDFYLKGFKNSHYFLNFFFVFLQNIPPCLTI